VIFNSNTTSTLSLVDVTTVNTVRTFTLSGLLSGTGNLIVKGNGTAGFLAITGGAGSNAAGDVTVSNAANINLQSNATLASINIGAGGGAIALAGGNLTTGANSSTFSGTISGTNQLIKSGPGTLTLTAANTYQGGTSVTVGELRVNNTVAGSATGTGTVGVGAAGLLAGTGTISGDTTFVSGAQVSPGDFGTSGKLSVGNFTLASGATLQVEVGGDHTGTPGVTFDQIAVSGSGKTFVVGGANLAVIPLGSVELNVPYRIVDATGNSVNAASKFANLLNGVNYDDGNVKYAVTYNSSSIDVTFTAVPEPTSFALLGTAIMCSLRRPRRRV
jgi:autotransporter-associated beta strand protein